MRVPLSWLREYAPVDAPPREIAAALVRHGLEVEKVEEHGDDVSGVVVGEVLEVEDLTEFKKPIRFVRVTTGDAERSVVCGARNFVAGDRVAVAVPGAALPGDFRITARETYGRTSDGMICSARELGIGDDHTGILVLPKDTPLGADVVAKLGLRDTVFDIAVTPDRGYCFSVRGVAREAAIAFGVPFADPGLAPVPAASGPGYEVVVEDVEACPRYVARVVRGLDPAARSPMWLRRRVTLAGMRSISLAVDVTNYVMLGLGQPLHAFDLSRLAGPIVVRRARAGEKVVTLDGVDREMHPEDVVIADDSGAIAMAGVMGGSTSEVAPGTTDILVESANFSAVATGRTSRRHLLVSEASKRFERGVDPDLAPVAAQLAVDLLVQLGGATADPGATDVDHRVPRPVIRMAADEPGRRAGVAYPLDVVRRRLADIGAAVTGEATLDVVPPPWRPDLTEPVDLTEEVMRLEGYDEIPSVLPRVPAGLGLTRRQRLHRRAGRALAGAGYVEVAPYPFMAPGSLDAMGLPPDDPRRRAPRIANPVSDEEPLLATTLLAGLATTLVRNVSRGLTDVSLFQIAPVFRTRPAAGPAPRPRGDALPDDETLASLDAALPEQPTYAAVMLTGLREPAGHWGPGRSASWADAVEAARTLATAVDAPALDVRPGDAAPWHPGRCAALLLGDDVVGWAGELHPRACAALGVPPRTCAAELDLDALFAASVEAVQAPLLSTFPPAAVDVALVVGRDVLAADVAAALRDGAGGLLEDLRLFDVFTGAQVGEGRKSLAYALRFRAPDRTLTDEEVNAMRDSAIAEAARRVGAELRS